MNKLLSPKKSMEPLTPEEARTLAQNISSIERIATMGREVLIQWVQENGPIDISEDNVWGADMETRDKIVPCRWSLESLFAVLDESYYEALSISKSKIYEAAGIVAAKKKVSKASIVREAMKALGESNAIEQVPQVKYHAMRKPEKGEE